jgi:hypothetical protein
MLLTRLQCQAVGWTPTAVDAHPDDAAGQRPLGGRFCRNVRGVRAAVAHGHAKPLGGANGDVGAELAGRHEQRQRQRIGGENRHSAGRMQPLNQLAMIANGPG